MNQLYDKLKRKLISMELKPGDKLSENFISSEEDMSRPQVRQVLTSLSDEGYLDILPQKGSVVTRIKKDIIREAAHAHLVLEQAILFELVNKRKNGEELEFVKEYVNMLKTIKKPQNEYDMLMLEWGFYNALYRLSFLKNSTYNYNTYNSSLNAWENTMMEIKLMSEQLENCQIELLTMICSNRYNSILSTVDFLEGIYTDFF